MPNFQKSVFELTKKIPKGKVSTYREIANASGTPAASRAVGNALNKNINPSVPCHRVVRSDGFVGGFRSGTSRKIELLRSEGIRIEGGKILNFRSVLFKFD